MLPLSHSLDKRARLRQLLLAVVAGLVVVSILLLRPASLLPTLALMAGADIPGLAEALEAAAESCESYGWQRFVPESSSGKRRVYDLFMINTELDWLEIRLGTTYDAVDYFIIFEADITFTGLAKPLFVRDNWSKFKRFHRKMIYHKVEFPPGFNATDMWKKERFTRDAMLEQGLQQLRGRQEPRAGDVIIFADVDEIPRPEVLHLLRACQFPRRVTLRGRFYYYSFQFLHRGDEWRAPHATYYEGLDTILPNDLRGGVGKNAHESVDIANASWHCSSCFKTVHEVRVKMESFSHTEYNIEKYRDSHWIADHVRQGTDMWERNREVYDRIDGNRDLPDYLLKHADRFPYMINRDGPNAGFSDYP
ncbi:hypothetical protein RJ55_03943 [Drechmeria coniospora]|nr:hypothetical protein RJ55_03943 [Drechmeria coniospora]